MKSIDEIKLQEKDIKVGYSNKRVETDNDGDERPVNQISPSPEYGLIGHDRATGLSPQHNMDKPCSCGKEGCSCSMQAGHVRKTDIC